jgi:hypothetical protein
MPGGFGMRRGIVLTGLAMILIACGCGGDEPPAKDYELEMDHQDDTGDDGQATSGPAVDEPDGGAADDGETADDEEEDVDDPEPDCVEPGDDCEEWDDCCDYPEQGYHCCPVFKFCVVDFW